MVHALVHASHCTHQYSHQERYTAQLGKGRTCQTAHVLVQQQFRIEVLEFWGLKCWQAGYLGKGSPAGNPGQTHANTLMLAQAKLHVLAVHAARRPLAADGPLAGLAQVRVTLPICTHAGHVQLRHCDRRAQMESGCVPSRQ